MKLRRLMLRLMLWSLGFAAVTGVAAVLIGVGDLPWRVVATGITTAVAAGLMIPLSMMVDREKSRSAGLLGMGTVVLEFIMALLLIWELNLFPAGVEEQIALTMLSLFLTAPPAMACLRLIHWSGGWWAARVGLGVCVLALASLLLGVWWSNSPWSQEEWAQTAGILAVYGLLAVICLVNGSASRRFPWHFAGAAAGALACAMALWEIWVGSGSDLGRTVFTTLTCAAAAAGHANLAALCPLKPGQRWLLYGTIASAIATVCLIDVLVINDIYLDLPWGQKEFLERLTAAAGILAGCGSLALLVLARLNRQVDFEPGTSDMLDITVVCPRCGKKQKAPIGGAACVGCQLRIKIQIEEPRCPQCGYLLYKLPSDRCPECGTLLSGA